VRLDLAKIAIPSPRADFEDRVQAGAPSSVGVKAWNRAPARIQTHRSTEWTRCGKLDSGGGMPHMNTQLPADLEQFVQAKVRSGRFSSTEEAIAAGVRLLREQEEAEEARVLDGIRQGLEDMRAGRTQPLAEAFADIRRSLDLPHGS
jgi:putative addiction module CopG family antidote